MLELNVIRRSNIVYMNPIKIVIKKNNMVRPCLHAQKLNKVLENNYEGPSGIDEVLQRCSNRPITSVSDLTASYWQIKLAKKYTAFRVDNHVYEFNVVPFGIKTSGSVLIRRLANAAYDFDDFLVLFVNDLIIQSQTFEEHIEYLGKLYDR